MKALKIVQPEVENCSNIVVNNIMPRKYIYKQFTKWTGV